MATPIRIATVLAAAAALLLALVGPGAAHADAVTNAKHFFWGQGQTGLAGTPADPLANDLIYHGGNAGAGAIGVEQKPAVYLIYWGQEWADGFQTSDTDGKLYSSKTLQNYVNSFFGSVGGSTWAGVQTQYCNVVLAGSTSCLGGAGFVTNPKNQLKGVWTDPTPVPDDIVAAGLAENLVDDPIAAEAQRAAGHFGYNPQATYIVLTPPRPIATGQPVYCGYHSQTTSIDGLGNPDRIQYAFIPWQNTNWPGIGTGLRHAQRQRDQQRVRQRHLRRLEHRHRPRVRRSGHRPGQHRDLAGRVARRTGQRERRQVRVDRHAEHHARFARVRSSAAVEQRGVRRDR